MSDLFGNKWFGIPRAASNPATPADLQCRWDAEHIDRSASNVRKALFGCNYIVEVRWRHIFQANYEAKDRPTCPMWELRKEFVEQYTYPFRELDDHCVVIEMRGIHTDDKDIFERNEFGADGVFVGTNNKADATMIALKYK